LATRRRGKEFTLRVSLAGVPLVTSNLTETFPRKRPANSCRVPAFGRVVHTQRMSRHSTQIDPPRRQTWLTLAVIGMFLVSMTVLAALNLLTGELMDVLVAILKLVLSSHALDEG